MVYVKKTAKFGLDRRCPDQRLALYLAAIVRPCLHDLGPALKRGTPPVALFNTRADLMR